ncbi:Ina22p [Lachancea thermotolerans CBS 6340]|uniref:KLTH0C00858p n=1 Tax=Lachancea thermotolerans (strain ATCC 56472 / CBS 6340 / NRRL Y-8284) TaxID=559295 RepID=C5DDG7_LACTC|nr:KLTH0C00858p [Lachancea thermotolerans CBS 6340]CAR21828.1 KLTH0C00858p [Lachancea thermotolerans CBS 6340]
MLILPITCRCEVNGESKLGRELEPLKTECPAFQLFLGASKKAEIGQNNLVASIAEAATARITSTLVTRAIKSRWNPTNNLIKMWNFSRLASRISRRLYSSSFPHASSKNPGNSKFDKTMLKPALVIVLFGSMLTNVMEQQKRNSELERRYGMKLGVLQDLIDKVKHGEDSSIDIDKELALVNKLFERFEISKYVELEEEASKVRKLNDQADVISQNEIAARLNGKKPVDDETSLRELFRDIMKDIDDIPVARNEESKQHDSKVVSSDQNKAIYQVEMKTVPESEIQTNERVLTEEAKNEKQRLKFRPATDSHVIVENPGEYSTAAEDHKVSKFL